MKKKNKNLEENENLMHFYRLQGMSLTFFQLLQVTDDMRLIFEMYGHVLNHFDDDIEETRTNLFFSFMKQASEMQGVSVEDLTRKLQNALYENDVAESEIGWVGQLLTKEAV